MVIAAIVGCGSKELKTK